MEHDGMNCGRIIRALLEVLKASIEEGLVTFPDTKRMTDWIDWYFDHHCQHCGGCDDIEALPPEQNGLCIYCWKAEYERQHTIDITPTA